VVVSRLTAACEWSRLLLVLSPSTPLARQGSWDRACGPPPTHLTSRRAQTLFAGLRLRLRDGFRLDLLASPDTAAFNSVRSACNRSSSAESGAGFKWTRDSRRGLRRGLVPKKRRYSTLAEQKILSRQRWRAIRVSDSHLMFQDPAPQGSRYNIVSISLGSVLLLLFPRTEEVPIFEIGREQFGPMRQSRADFVDLVQFFREPRFHVWDVLFQKSFELLDDAIFRLSARWASFTLLVEQRFHRGDDGHERDKHPRHILRVHIHLRRNRDVIDRAWSRDDPAKPEKRRLRESPKERESLLHQPALLLPAPKRQPRTPIQPPAMAGIFDQDFLPGTILETSFPMICGSCSPAEPSSV